jgi:hypothetical protein
VTLVGKAVALISMLAQEFIFVFNEEGSGYVNRTRKMNDFLQANGVSLDMRPILRLRHHTWDALAEGKSTLTLPDHLASAFGQRQIPSRDFAANWRDVVDGQAELLSTLKGIRKRRDLLNFLAQRLGGAWEEQRQAYDGAKEGLCQVREKAAEIDSRVRQAYGRLADVKKQIVAAEAEKSAHFRSTREWTDAQKNVRRGYSEAIAKLLNERHELLADIRGMKQKRLAIERGGEAAALRRALDEVELSAERERLNLVRTAILTATGLPHTDHRPTAWWLPMVDPSGAWFNQIAGTTEVYTEPLLTPSN